MALQTSISSRDRSKLTGQAKTQKTNQKAKDVPQAQWVEDTPSFLEALQISLAELTEEDKESIHLSLQG